LGEKPEVIGVGARFDEQGGRERKYEDKEGGKGGIWEHGGQEGKSVPSNDKMVSWGWPTVWRLGGCLWGKTKEKTWKNKDSPKS